LEFFKLFEGVVREKCKAPIFTEALSLVFNDTRDVKELHKLLLTNVEDPAVRVIVTKMVCDRRERLTVQELLNHPIVQTWKKVIRLDNHRDIDLLELGDECIIGLLSSVKSISQPKVVVNSLYLIDKFLSETSDKKKITKRCNLIIEHGGVDIVLEYTNTLIKTLVPATSNLKTEKEKDERKTLKSIALTSLISNTNSDDMMSSGWYLSIKIIATVISNTDKCNSVLRKIAMSMRIHGIFDLFGSLTHFKDTKKISSQSLKCALDLIEFMCEHSLTVRNRYGFPLFVKALLSVYTDEFKGSIIGILVYIILYVNDDELISTILNLFSIEFLDVVVSFATPQVLKSKINILEKHYEAIGGVLGKIELMESVKENGIQKAYYGLCSNVERGDVHEKMWWFNCNTCFPNDKHLGCCMVCAYHCHFGHELEVVYSNGFYCDCHVAEQRGTHVCKCKKDTADLLSHLQYMSPTNLQNLECLL